MTTVAKAVKRFTGEAAHVGDTYGLLVDGEKFAPFFTEGDELFGLPEGATFADALEPYYQEALLLYKDDRLFLIYNDDPGTVEEI